MKRLGLLLVALGLLAGTAGCLPPRYTLTVTSTGGGSVIMPGEGTFTYFRGTVVRLVARSALGYAFVRWTGDVETVNNVSSFSTSITMNADYSITANFGCGC